MVRARSRSLATLGHGGPYKWNMSIVYDSVCHWLFISCEGW